VKHTFYHCSRLEYMLRLSSFRLYVWILFFLLSLSASHVLLAQIDQVPPRQTTKNKYLDMTLAELLRTDVKSAKTIASSVKKLLKVPLSELLNTQVERTTYTQEEMMQLSLDKLLGLDIQEATGSNPTMASYLSMNLDDLLEVSTEHSVKDFSFKQLLVLPLEELVNLRLPATTRKKLTKPQMMKMSLDELLGLEIDTKQ
jgi:hypothetical protein